MSPNKLSTPRTNPKHEAARITRGSVIACLITFVLVASGELNAGAIASEMPTPLTTPLPAVPRDLAELTVGKPLELRFWVTDTGDVRWAKAVDSPDERLSALVEKAAYLWKFRPAFHDGKTPAVMGGATVTVRPDGLRVDEWKLHKEVDEQPKVVESFPPRYPFALVREGVEGRVVVQFVVDEKGTVMNPMILNSTNRRFDEPAVESVQGWMFTPAVYRGKPVASVFEMPITFTLAARGSSSRFEIRSKGDRSVPEEYRFDSAATVRQSVIVVYPWELAVAGKKGSAEVRFVIGRNGRVLSTEVIKATAPELGLALAASIESWTFDPATREKAKVMSIASRSHEFNLGKPDFEIDEETARIAGVIKRGEFEPASARQLDVPLKPRSLVPPVYPTALRESQATGSVSIEVVVNREGKVVLPRIIEATEPAFGWAAATAVQRWTFEPPTVGGQPVEVKVVIPFKFTAPSETAEGVD